MTALPARAEAGARMPTSMFSFAAFEAVAERLEAVLDTETDALKTNRPCDMNEICQRKRQSLLELSRFLPRLATSEEREGARSRLGTLTVKLEHNRQAIDVQLRAVREISDIIASSMREAESDGTYSFMNGRP